MLFLFWIAFFLICNLDRFCFIFDFLLWKSYASRRVKNYSTRVWLTVTKNILYLPEGKIRIHRLYSFLFVCLAQHSGDHIVPGLWTCAPVMWSILSAYWAISPAHSLCSYWAASKNGIIGFSFWLELGWGRKFGKMLPSGHCVEDSVEGGDRQCQYCQCYPVDMLLLPLIFLLLPFTTSSALQSSPQPAPGQQSFFLHVALLRISQNLVYSVQTSLRNLVFHLS